MVERWRFINILTFTAMFQVQIGPHGSADSGFVPVSSFPNVESALAFALELHRVSNLPHTVVVFDSDFMAVVTLSFELKGK